MKQEARNLAALGSRSSPAAAFVWRAYEHAVRATDRSTLDLLEVWLKRFRLIHGELDTQRQHNVAAVPRAYGATINNQRELFLFIYALEVYFSTVLRLLGYRAATGRATAAVDLSSIVTSDALAPAGIFNYSVDPEFDCVHLRSEGFEALSSLAPLVDDIAIGSYDRDLIKYLHHEVFPKDLRHSLGEIYTPDWLVDLALDDVTADDANPELRSYVDPTCGSGTFLVELVRRFGPASDGRILDRIVGFDINPVSALAAKTNLILAGQKWLQQRSQPYVLPVYEADCLHSLLAHDHAADGGATGIAQLPASYLRVRESLGAAADMSGDVSRRVDRIAASLATTIVRDADYVVGNPPWVNWEYLPDDYRRSTVDAWQRYGLFDLRGRDSTFIKEDIAALITYVAADRFLRHGGKLGFVIKQTLFKSSRQGEGFRKFRLGPHGAHLGVRKLEDLSRIRAFPGVGARTSLLILEKGPETVFPVAYNEWEPGDRASFKETESLAAVLSSVTVQRKHAYPSDQQNKHSGWTSIDPAARDDVASAFGSSAYKARTGVFTGGLNAVYWLEVLEDRGSRVLVRNLTSSARNKVRDVVLEVEKELVYPFLGGSDLELWSSQLTKYILLPHTAQTRMEPISAAQIREKFPRSWHYLESFQEELTRRKGFAGWEKHLHRRFFYALQRIGAYTFAKYKVGWKFISRTFTPSVIGPTEDKFVGSKIVIPNEKVIYVGLDSEEEAYFLCGVLSSTFYRRAVESFMVETQIGPGVLGKLKIPLFDAHSDVHRRVSALCRAGHVSGDTDDSIREIDRIVS